MGSGRQLPNTDHACQPALAPQLAHKLGSAWHVPHGLANALLISHVIRYNSTDRPLKQAAFPQVWAAGRRKSRQGIAGVGEV